MPIPMRRAGETIVNQERLEEARRFFTFRYVETNNSATVELPEFTNPYSFDFTRYLPNEHQATIEKFFETVKEVVDHIREREKKPPVSITEEYPPADMSTLGTCIISFRIVKRAPAKMSQDGTRYQHKRYRRNYSEFRAENEILVSARPLDHEVELCIWATTNKEANQMALWLEQEMVKKEWVFLARGFKNVEFLERLSDGYMNIDNNKLFYRPLRFFVRLEEFTTEAVAGLKELTVNLKLRTDLLA
jgi:hypothetical protein